MIIAYLVKDRGWDWLASSDGQGHVLDDDVGDEDALVELLDLKRGGEGRGRQSCGKEGGETHFK